ncbi:tetratricopeptide repeat protein [Allorhizocola rhizosphaerae]|uniref:tetratricopeptide repeat protein n=1 Tax=Allorhizocola rhizosphaerae TaxID=1872709 RepID=UPI000E3B6D42|nr:hypothetical protein [Allorhizocola rhizosphaerae]
MHRWQRSHGRIGANAPSWLTFEVHRPYFDGDDSPLTAIQSRGPLLAARLFAARDPMTPRFGMLMPASFRHLLTEESRLVEYRVSSPDQLDPELASPDWQMMADAYRRADRLDGVDRAGLALWLLAVCLPEALLRLVPDDLDAGLCSDPLLATVQCARANALLQSGSPAQTAFGRVIAAAEPSVAQVQALSSWGYYLARHASDWSAAREHAQRAQRLLDELDLPVFDRGLLQARLLVREVMHADRAGELDRAWELLDRARATVESVRQVDPGTPEQQELTAEMLRRIIDRRVEIAVKRGDAEAEQATVQEGLQLDPYCVKMRMQQAQAAQRRGDIEAALTAYLTAARLGPHGTAFALLGAAECAQRLGRKEFARVLTERAYRTAPRAEQTRAALAKTYADEPIASVFAKPTAGHEANWHYRMYGAYFNLGASGSPCLYAGLPTFAFDFAEAGGQPRVGPQRVMPPAFRTNLIRESGLSEFAATHPAQVPERLRTPRWARLCEWVDGYRDADPHRQYQTSHVLFRLGFRELLLELAPRRTVASLREPIEFYHQAWIDMARYAGSVGGRNPVPPKDIFEMVDHPMCPLHLRLTGAVAGVVFAARGTKSLQDATRWRDRAQEFLDTVLADDGFTEFEKVMLESRFYRGVGFVPFMRGDKAGTVEDMRRAEELARAVPATTEWEEFLKRENLHACLESRSKEAFGLRDVPLGIERTLEFLSLDPYDPKSHIELAEALSKQERFAEAGESYLRAARLGPLGTAIGYAMAGECFSRAGDAVAAEDCFVQSLRIDPYAISAARGWRRVTGGSPLAHEYAGQLEEWGAAMRERKIAA